MGIPRESHGNGNSHSHAHLYSTALLTGSGCENWVSQRDRVAGRGACARVCVNDVQLPKLPAHAAYCVESWPTPADRHAYAVFLLLSTYVGPIVAIIVSYALIGRSLCLGAASTSSTPSGSLTARRPAASTTAAVGRNGPLAAVRGCVAQHGAGLPQGAGVESWPGGGSGGGAGTLMMVPSMPGPISSGRCSREAGTPAGSGLQVCRDLTALLTGVRFIKLLASGSDSGVED